MTTQELLDLFGGMADDVGSPPLWSNAVRLGFLNEAQLEACRRARLLVDGDTEDVCRITVEAGTQVYDVDPRVIFIREVRFVDAEDAEHRLQKVHAKDLEKHAPGWRNSEATSVPVWWTPYGNQKICIEKTTGAGVLHLDVVREPLEDCRLAADPIEAVAPEIPARYQHKLVDWMLYRALSMRDKEEKYDPKSAADHLALFEQEFGPRSSAIDETWIQRQHGYDEYEGLY